MENYQMTIHDEQDLDDLSPLAYIDTWESHIVKDKEAGTIHWLNRSAPDEPFFMIGVWNYIPDDHSNNKVYFRYGNNDMMFYVFEGEAEFCASDGKTTSIRKNDKFFIPKSAKGTWKILKPFATLFAQTNPSQKHDYPNHLSFRTLKIAEVLTRLKLKDPETLVV